MRLESQKRTIITLVIAFQLFLLVATTPLQAENSSPPETIIKEQKISSVVEESEGVEGKA